MGIVNRRNAVVGWLVVKIGKRAAKKKAQGAVPGGARTGGAVAGGLAALGGVLFFWRKKKRDSAA
jgi:LPXTG-motif cell wall-anchored protein